MISKIYTSAYFSVNCVHKLYKISKIVCAQNVISVLCNKFEFYLVYVWAHTYTEHFYVHFLQMASLNGRHVRVVWLPIRYQNQNFVCMHSSTNFKVAVYSILQGNTYGCTPEWYCMSPMTFNNASKLLCTFNVNTWCTIDAYVSNATRMCRGPMTQF